jgi:pimeloyl-ACP methyl ester carboxylesterase
LIDNAGIESPQLSELSREIQAGRNPLIVEEPAGMQRLLAFTMVDPPLIPDGLLTRLYQKNAPYRDLNKRIFADLVNRGPVMERILPEIKAPILVMWGDQDRVLDVSSTEVIRKLRADATVKILKDCGHAPMIERPEESARLFLGFLGNQGSAGSR